ncbi:SusC/RagA family TonB-linked outer membrane protein [Sphingobacterium sp. UT-1RO-CII-1]|nr:SusC/RagA family TonB-linked outer membrane protein [Sphingobacterium sp. UT-1RO-CII-1]
MYRNYLKKIGIDRSLYRRIWLIMQLTSLLLLFTLMQVSANSFAQKVSLNHSKGSLKTIFKDLKVQTGYNFLYTESLLKKSVPVDIHVTNKDFEQVLSQIFVSQPLSYELDSKTIVIREKIKIDNKTEVIIKDLLNLAVIQQAIRGRVMNEHGDVISGATVRVKGTNIATSTNDEGMYEINESRSSVVLVFSAIGFASQEVAVHGQQDVSVVLKEQLADLEDVVVIGYGTAKKKDLTGAVSSIKTEDLGGQAPRNVTDILRANAPGVNIGIATDAKSEASVSIRGNGSLTASNEPLIVLDNVIYFGSLADINPNDIANIDILKDASSAAVYGSRSANGVIVITTKKGKSGKPLINFSANTGLATVANKQKIHDENSFLKFRQDYNEGRVGEEYLDKYKEMFVNPGDLKRVDPVTWYNYDQSVPVSSANDQELTKKWLSRLNLTSPEIDNYFAGKITKWDDLVFQTGLQQDYNVSVANTSEYTSQYLSLGYIDREGIVVGDKFKNITARANLESKIASFLTTGINAQFASRDDGSLRVDWGQMTMISPYGSNNLDDLNSAYRKRPTGLDPINPLYEKLYIDRNQSTQTLNATLYAKVKLPFGIQYTINYNPYFNHQNYFNHNSSKSETYQPVGGAVQRNNTKWFSWQIDNILNWQKRIADKHQVEVTLLANAEKGQYWYTGVSAQGFTPNDDLGYHSLQSASTNTISSNDTYKTADALMGRLFYSYDDRYMFTGSVRKDGYSAFGKLNPRSVFTSVALGWVFSEEAFFNNDSFLNYGKLRLSWGENGNREIGQYAALAQMGSGLLPYINSSGSIYNISQIYLTSMANYNLKWERTATYNFGLDFGILNNRVSGALDAYVSQTSDLLMSRALPNITGFNSVMSNLGRVSNYGVELSLQATVINNDRFNWKLFSTYSMNRRKIKSLYGDMISVFDDSGTLIEQKEANDENNGWFIDQDPDRIWSYKRTGIWQLDEKETAATYGLQPGDFKYLDQNDDGIMDNRDKVFQGYRTPRSRISLRSQMSYKGFDFSFMVYSYLNYYGGFQRAANTYAFPDRTSDYDLPRWTSTNPINDYARIGSKNIGTNWVNKTFFRLEHVTLSYNIPKHLIKAAKIENVKLNFSIQNAAVYSKNWSFWDPESETATPRTFNFGINLTL